MCQKFYKSNLLKIVYWSDPNESLSQQANYPKDDVIFVTSIRN